MKSLAIFLLTFAFSLSLGVYLGAKYLGQGEVVAVVCVMGDSAVKEGLLSREQFLFLSEETGKHIQSNYPMLAQNIKLNPQKIKQASENSNCSQILVSLSKGIEKG